MNTDRLIVQVGRNITGTIVLNANISNTNIMENNLVTGINMNSFATNNNLSNPSGNDDGGLLSLVHSKENIINCGGLELSS